jgi:hypothetical protein
MNISFSYWSNNEYLFYLIGYLLLYASRSAEHTFRGGRFGPTRVFHFCCCKRVVFLRLFACFGFDIKAIVPRGRIEEEQTKFVKIIKSDYVNPHGASLPIGKIIKENWG